MVEPRATASSSRAERERIVEAYTDLVAGRGYAATTVAMVTERAGVEEAAFHRHFADSEDCFCEVLKEMIDELVRRSLGAFEAERLWLDQMRAVAYVIVDFLLEDPRRARFLYVEVLSLGERARMIRDESLTVFVDLIDRGREEMDESSPVSRATAEGLAGAVYRRLHVIAIEGRLETLPALAPQLLYTVVLPYAGSAVAEAELQRPPPPRRSGPGRGYSGSVQEERSGPGTDASRELGPLPAGRHGLTREQVAHSQRERLVAGLAHAVAEHGYNAVTIAHITKAAAVSRRVFYENFESKEDCFLAAFDIVIEHLRELMDEAARDYEDWPHQTIARLRAMLRFFASEPGLARLTLLDSLTAGPVVAERFRIALLSFEPLLEPGRALRKSKRPLPESREETLLGGASSLMTRSIAVGRAEQLEELLPDLTEFVLTPYLGPDEAERLAAELR